MHINLVARLQARAAQLPAAPPLALLPADSCLCCVVRAGYVIVTSPPQVRPKRINQILFAWCAARRTNIAAPPARCLRCTGRLAREAERLSAAND